MDLNLFMFWCTVFLFFVFKQNVNSTKLFVCRLKNLGRTNLLFNIWSEEKSSVTDLAKSLVSGSAPLFTWTQSFPHNSRATYIQTGDKGSKNPSSQQESVVNYANRRGQLGLLQDWSTFQVGVHESLLSKNPSSQQESVVNYANRLGQLGLLQDWSNFQVGTRSLVLGQAQAMINFLIGLTAPRLDSYLLLNMCNVILLAFSWPETQFFCPLNFKV